MGFRGGSACLSCSYLYSGLVATFCMLRTDFRLGPGTLLDILTSINNNIIVVLPVR
jgi:hypothetical protein